MGQEGLPSPVFERFSVVLSLLETWSSGYEEPRTLLPAWGSER